MPEPTPDAWAQIRHDYEHTDKPLAHICAENEITIPMLRYRMRRWEWRRRKPLIPREGPPAVAAAADCFLHPPLEGEGKEEAVPMYHPALAPPGEGEANIVPRLQSAVARILPAIEATIARLAQGPQRPRDMEQAGRALSSLIRALRELNALLAEHKAREAAAAAEPEPYDMDEFRASLTRKIEAILAAENEESGQANLEET